MKSFCGGFCGEADDDGHLFSECTHPPLVQLRENPELTELIHMDKMHGPGYLHWHGWLPALSGNSFGSPWTTSTEDIASPKLEWVWGAYSDNLALRWHVDDGYDADSAAEALSAQTDTWTDGSMEKDDVSMVCAGWCWEVFKKLFCLFRRASFVDTWTTLVPGNVSCSVLSLGHCKPFRGLSCVLFSLCKLALVTTISMLFDEMVRMGVVEQIDKDGHDHADKAADLCRTHVDANLIDVRRVFSQACHVWYLVVYGLNCS